MVMHILVAAAGDAADASVFETALAFGSEPGAYLEFLHVRPDPAAAAISMASGGMDGGYGMELLMETVEKDGAAMEAAARAAWSAFCAAHHLGTETGRAGAGATAALLVAVGDEATCLVEHGRTADLVVIGRSHHGEAVDIGRLQTVLNGIGRPLLIAAMNCPTAPLDTVVIAWKDRAEAARAVAVAMPLIIRAKHVLVLTVGEESASETRDLDGALASRDRLVASLSRHAPHVEARDVPLGDGTAVEALLAAAVMAGAGLLVMAAMATANCARWCSAVSHKPCCARHRYLC